MSDATTVNRLPDVFTDPASGQRINLLDYKAANLRMSWVMALLTMALLAGLAYLISLLTDVASSTFFVGTAVAIGGAQGAVG